MAITSELIKANPALAELTEEQISALTTLTENSEKEAIGKAVAGIHKQYENDLKQVTGKEKEPGEKTYDFLKQVVAEYKKEPERDKALEKQLKDSLQMLEQYKKAASDDISKLQARNDELEKELYDNTIDLEFNNAISNLTFKPGLGDGTTKLLVQAAKNEMLKNVQVDYVDNGTGGKQLVFRNKDGEIMRNPSKSLNPYTAEDLMKEKLKEVLLSPAPNGPIPGMPIPKRPNNIEFSEYAPRTQVEATRMIVDGLLKKGLTRTDSKFTESLNKEFKEGGYINLPIR